MKPPIVQVDFDPTALAPLEQRAQSELEGVRGVEITSEDDARLAAEVLVSIAAVKKDCEAQSKEWLAPLKAETERIRAPFLKIEKLCDEARGLLSKAIGAFQLARAEAQRKALAAATEAVKRDDERGLTTALQTVSASAPVATKGVSVRAKWVAKVVDAVVVPREFCTPDLKKLAAHADRYPINETPPPVPGVVFDLETSTVVRTKGLA
jgi:hypothetical protein